MSETLRLPALNSYAERPDARDTALDRWSHRAVGAITSRGATLRGLALRPIVAAADQHAARFAEMETDALVQHAQKLRPGLRQAVARTRLRASDFGEVFALIREMADRTLGLRHYDVQLMGAWAMLQGQIAEMRTGEGKTLCATLASSTMALAGVPVHLITVNDYLAARDAEEMQPLYHALGLSVDVVQEGQSPDARTQIYQADIVHGANKELAFDYLWDRMSLRKLSGTLARKLSALDRASPDLLLRMRGLHFALVDEADSVLIDEARTPLIISGAVKAQEMQSERFLRHVLEMARRLETGRDYRILSHDRRVELTARGMDRLADMADDDPGPFGIEVIREAAITQALTADQLFIRDVDYIVKDDKVMIVDENTGRVQEDRSWSEGLHQFVELKEGVALTDPRETMARITYQRIYRRYGTLAGMTGTARDAAWELRAVYGLAVAKVPTHKPDQRRFRPPRVYLREASKWEAVGKVVDQLHREGAAILLGTRSVAGSEAASARLTELGIPHQVLSAAQDADEAALIARAGQPGTVTVATNMAGRGVDIKLAPEVKANGGLYVLLTERHDSKRVDRQLEGRCGRQGDPGEVLTYLSVEDEILRPRGARLHRAMAGLVLPFGSWAAASVIRARQRAVERGHAQSRYALLASDMQLGDMFAVAGHLE